MASPFDILVAGEWGSDALSRLQEIGRVRQASAEDEAVLRQEVVGAEALLVKTGGRVTAEVIAAADRLRVIGRAGVGLDSIDVRAACERGIVMVYTPAAASDSVAEYTIGLMLALERHLVQAHAMVRTGRFREARRRLLGRELRGRTLGIVGMGRIGSRVGRIAQCGLGMKVVYNDIIPIGPLGFPAESMTKEQLWSECDVVSLHVPLTEQTHHLVDAFVLRQFQGTATLINTSRGAVVDTDALADALSAGRLAGAALDVFEVEPPPREHPLLALPNVLLSPHLSARTHEGLSRMECVVDDVIAVLQGRPPQYPAPADNPLATER